MALVHSEAPSTVNKSTAFGWFMCGLGALYYAYEYFLRITPSVIHFQLQEAFQINGAVLGFTVSLFYFAYTPLQLPVGVLMDRFGPRKLLSFACLICGIGAFLFGSSHLLFLVQVGRFLVGFGSAFAFVGVLKLATIWLPPHRFALMSGLTMCLGNLGAIFGQRPLVAMVENIGWRESVIVSAWAGVALTVVLYLFLRDKGTRPGEALPEGEADINHESFNGRDTSFRGVWTGFLEMIKNPQIWLVGVVGFLMYIPTSSFVEFWANSFFESEGFDAAQGASAVSMVFWGWIIGGPVVGFLSDKFRLRKLPITIGSFLGCAIVSLVIFVPTLSLQYIEVLMFGFGLVLSPHVLVFALARENSPMRTAATAIAFTNLLVMFSGIIFQPLIGEFLDIGWKLGWTGRIVHGVHLYPLVDYEAALAVIPASLFIAGVLTLFIKDTKATLVHEEQSSESA